MENHKEFVKKFFNEDNSVTKEARDAITDLRSSLSELRMKAYRYGFPLNVYFRERFFNPYEYKHIGEREKSMLMNNLIDTIKDFNNPQQFIPIHFSK